MPNFIEVGSRKINVDQILWLLKSGQTVKVIFSGAPEALVFSGDDAEILWRIIHAQRGSSSEAPKVARI